MSPRKFLRLWLKTAFGGHWFGVVDRVATLLSIGVPCLIWRYPALAGRVANLTWEIPLAIAAPLPVLRLAVAPYWMHRDVERERDELRERLEEVERTRPRLKVAAASWTGEGSRTASPTVGRSSLCTR